MTFGASTVQGGRRRAPGADARTSRLKLLEFEAGILRHMRAMGFARAWVSAMANGK